MNADLAKDRLKRELLVLTSQPRIVRQCRFVLNPEGARALEEKVALAAARCAAQPVLDPDRLRAARTACLASLAMLGLAAALLAHLFVSAGA